MNMLNLHRQLLRLDRQPIERGEGSFACYISHEQGWYFNAVNAESHIWSFYSVFYSITVKICDIALFAFLKSLAMRGVCGSRRSKIVKYRTNR